MIEIVFLGLTMVAECRLQSNRGKVTGKEGAGRAFRLAVLYSGLALQN